LAEVASLTINGRGSKTMNKRYALPLTIEQSGMIVKAMEVYYAKVLRKAERLAKHYGDSKGRSAKDSHTLAEIQECLQYITLIHNIETNKLNVDVAASGGLTVEEEKADDSTGKSVNS
jgi:hypothetical protein